MAQEYSDFRTFLAEEVRKYDGVYVPVHAGLLRRALIRKAKYTSLHPNPEDEFTFPDIGPNYEIISQYVSVIKDAHRRYYKDIFDEPITVQKIRPDGYLILNGHHRWAAAMRMRLKKVPIHIVDLTQAADLVAMYKKAKHNRRVTLDLDEVVFCREDMQDEAEKALPFPANRIYKERPRLGIPALFHFLRNNGYDVWVYSSKLYSMDYIAALFLHYRVHLTGIVTGTERKIAKDVMKRKELEKDLRNTYDVTIEVQRDALIRVDRRTGNYEEYPIRGRQNWSVEVINIFRELDQKEKEKEVDHG